MGSALNYRHRNTESCAFSTINKNDSPNRVTAHDASRATDSIEHEICSSMFHGASICRGTYIHCEKQRQKKKERDKRKITFILSCRITFTKARLPQIHNVICSDIVCIKSIKYLKRKQKFERKNTIAFVINLPR